MFVVYEAQAASTIALRLNEAIAASDTTAWLEGAQCSVAEEFEECLIDEAQALELWLATHDDARTSHLDAVPSPDGELVQPSHDTTTTVPMGATSPTDAHLVRDPGLLEDDNVPRGDEWGGREGGQIRCLLPFLKHIF